MANRDFTLVQLQPHMETVIILAARIGESKTISIMKEILSLEIFGVLPISETKLINACTQKDGERDK